MAIAVKSQNALPTESLDSKVRQARDAITSRKLFQPQVALVLGSGLGSLSQQVEHATMIPYCDVPHFPKTHANGHSGNIVLGYLAGLPVAILNGRAHRYEGWLNSQVAFPIHCLHALGARTLVTTNAAGGLNPRFQVGDLMAIDSHINCLWTQRQSDFILDYDDQTGHGLVLARGESPYSTALTQRARAVARRRDVVMHQGCYLATLGPTYETRSEYRMFRWMGADAVGMSTIPEVMSASRLGMETLGVSVITNVASTDVPQSTTHQEVVDCGQLAGPRLMGIIRQILEEMAGQPD